LESLLLNWEMECIGICRSTPNGVSPIVLSLLGKNICEVTERNNALYILFEDNTEGDAGIPPDNVKSALLQKGVRRLSQRDAATVIHYQDGSEYSFIAPEQIAFEYALASEEPISSSEGMTALLGKRPLRLAIDDKKELSAVFSDSTVYSASAHELFTMEDLTPLFQTTKEAGVGECLQKWHIGCKELVYNNFFSGITVNTWKHMYIFEMTKDSVYCRAARYAACDAGVVFDQNFRQGFQAYMIEDNRVAMEGLDYDKRLFSAEACVWKGKSVYWSTAYVTDTEIELHGCQGDVYKWRKPDR
jgi:hypothetical protein